MDVVAVTATRTQSRHREVNLLHPKDPGTAFWKQHTWPVRVICQMRFNEVGGSFWGDFVARIVVCEMVQTFGSFFKKPGGKLKELFT